MSDTVIEYSGVSLCRGTFRLDDVSFKVRESECLAILGRTGAGKTMVLEAGAGFTVPDRGNVWYYGKEVSRIPIHERNIGFLYQDHSLFPHMTAGQNIGYGLKIRGEDKKVIKKRVEELAEQFGISRILDQYPGTLSGGEQQRTALARALILKPSLLLLDEPSSSLDPSTRKQLYELLMKIRKEFSCAVILVTHNFDEAQLLADRVAVLMDGRVQGIVDSKELFTAEWTGDVKQFLGMENVK